MKTDLFRKAALERMSTPDQIDQLMPVTSSKGWIALITLAGLLIALVLWGIFGTISVEVQGQGVLVRPDGLQTVAAPSSGEVTALTIRPGDTLKSGQVIGKLKTDSQTIDLVSSYNGKVSEVLTSVGSQLTTGASVAQLETDAPLEAFAFVSLQDGKQLQPGMQIELSPSTAQAGQYGFLLGKVSYISDYPVSEQGLQSLLKNDELAKVILSNGPVYEVQVNLTTDASTYTGFKWSASKGPQTILSSGTLCDARFVVGQVSPINLVLPVKS